MDAPTAPTAPTALAWGPLWQAHPLAHFVYDPVSLRLLAANEAALLRYGYSRADFLARTRADLLLPGELPALRAFLAALPASASADTQRVWLEHTSDGRVLHADVRGMPVLFEGRPARLAAVVDAGSRMRLEAAAAGARDLLVVAGRMAHLGGWSIDLPQRRVHWSDEVCAIHEVPPGSEYSLDAAIAFYPGAATGTMAAALRACIDSGTPFDLELPLRTARGQQRWVRAAGAAVRDGSGRIVAIEGAQQDITERKRSELALDESRRRLAALLGAIPDLWFVFDADGRFEEVSDPQHPALSAPWSEKHGRLIADTLPPESAQAAMRMLADAHAPTAAPADSPAAVQAGAQPRSHHYQLVVQGGERRSFEARCVALGSGRTLMLVRDVTETFQLEQRFRAMADAAPIGIYMTDPEGRCTYTNPAWQRLYGLSLEDSMGHRWVRVVHPDDRARVLQALNEAAGAGLVLQFRLQPSADTVREVEARAGPIVRADGQVLGHVGTVVDVTHAHRLEAAQRAQAVAEEAGRRQSAFMSRVSHELRTPLNAILGFGQLLQQAPNLAEQRAKAYAGHVVQAGQHMLALVDDLLELQRLEQGQLALEKAPIELGPLLATCAEMLRPAAQDAGVELVVTAPPGLVVHSDLRCLRQMLLNLVSNAVKYGGCTESTPGAGAGGVPGGGARANRVVLTAEKVEGAVQLSVVDQGPGMTPAQLQRLFRPFDRLGQEAGSRPGTGLGLVITRHLADMVGAQMMVASEPGRGTTATVRLPG